jgi:membrane-associated protease RseP (regulator of RpoE activity)
MRWKLLLVSLCLVPWCAGPAFAGVFRRCHSYYPGPVCERPCPPSCIVLMTYSSGAKLSKVIYAKPATVPGFPGNASSLVPGDIILEADGTKIASQEALREAVKNANGKVLRLVVLDSASQQTFVTAVDLHASEADKFGLDYNIVPVNVSTWYHLLQRP